MNDCVVPCDCCTGTIVLVTSSGTTWRRVVTTSSLPLRRVTTAVNVLMWVSTKVMVEEIDEPANCRSSSAIEDGASVAVSVVDSVAVSSMDGSMLPDHDGSKLLPIATEARTGSDNRAVGLKLSCLGRETGSKVGSTTCLNISGDWVSNDSSAS